MKQVSPKKHLGQHFLKDENIAINIVEGLVQPNPSTILEIGPGTGVLTKHLLDRPDFMAFDVDADSIEYLKSNYPEHQSKFHLQDFLKYDLGNIESPMAVSQRAAELDGVYRTMEVAIEAYFAQYGGTAVPSQTNLEAAGLIRDTSANSTINTTTGDVSGANDCSAVVN